MRNFVIVREVETGLWLFGAGVEFPTVANYEQAPHPGAYFIRTDLMKRYKWDGSSWVEDGGTGGPGGLAVQEADGAPSVAAVDTILFDQGDGFVLTDLGAGDVRLDLDAIPIATISGLGTALSNKQETSAKGAALGYASLDAGVTVPDAQIPAGIQRTSAKGAISGYCELDGSALVPDARLSANIARALRVLELDSAPSVMPVDQIAFDQADGFVLTDLGSGDVRVDLSGVPEANLSLSFPTHSNANDPSAGEKAALAGTSGTPGVANKYVTDGDGRNTNARSPTGNLSTTLPLAGGGALSAGLTLTVNDFVASGASHARGTVPDPGVTPGTTKFLREDASWQAPPAGGSPPTGTGVRYVTAGVEDAASKAPTDLTAPLDLFTSTLRGLVPLSGGGTTNFLRADGNWAPAGGSGADPPEGSYEPGSYTIATGKFRHAVKRQQFTGAQRLTVQGTGRLSVSN